MPSTVRLANQPTLHPPAGNLRRDGRMDRVLIVRATKKLLARIGPANLREAESTTLLGP